ncbi:MAG: MarR family transcriptional regulator [Anaerolineae bacterium]|nr:MarR family transcriptional regulator [Anaerolineae bacterium]
MTMPRSLDHALGQVCHLHHGRIREQFHDLGLYRGQPKVLEALAEEDGRTHSELAALMYVAPATVTKMVQRMEKTGYVMRRDDPDDQRVSRVYLTEAGRAVLIRLREVFESLNAETFADFSPEERAQLEYLLMKVRENLLRVTAGNCAG